MYVPKPEASVVDAATKVVGKGITDQCEWKLWSTPGGKARETNEEIYNFECLLPRHQCGKLGSLDCDLQNLLMRRCHRHPIYKQRRPILVCRLEACRLLTGHIQTDRKPAESLSKIKLYRAKGRKDY